MRHPEAGVWPMSKVLSTPKYARRQMQNLASSFVRLPLPSVKITFSLVQKKERKKVL